MEKSGLCPLTCAPPSSDTSLQNRIPSCSRRGLRDERLERRARARQMRKKPLKLALSVNLPVCPFCLDAVGRPVHPRVVSERPIRRTNGASSIAGTPRAAGSLKVPSRTVDGVLGQWLSARVAVPTGILSPSERLAETYSLLALGAIRLRARQSSQVSAAAGESSLHFAPGQSGHAKLERRRTA